MQSGLYFEHYVKDGKLKSRLKISMYVYQLLAWWGIVLVSKIVLAILQLISTSWLEEFGVAVLYPFSNPKLKLIVVMIFFPIILNSIQFWVQDNFLKLKKEVYPQLELPQSNQMEYVLPDNNDNNEYIDQHWKSGQEIKIDFDQNNNHYDNDNSHKNDDKLKPFKEKSPRNTNSNSINKNIGKNSNDGEINFFGIHDKNNIHNIESMIKGSYQSNSNKKV